MTVQPLTEQQLKGLQRSSLIPIIIEGVRGISQQIDLNKLSASPQILLQQKEVIIKIGNLLKILSILVEECKHEPLTGKILLEAEGLLQILQKLRALEGTELVEKFSRLSRKDALRLDVRLDMILQHFQEWQWLMQKKIHLPPGNKHTHDCYHPRYPKTYPFKPSFLPDDYRSNFFFEAKVKELCPFTTLLALTHPYSDIQSQSQASRSLADLTTADVEVDLRDPMAIEQRDNIRALRLDGPGDDARYPGSYILVKGGHHRLRELYRRYLANKISGELKILIQLVELKDIVNYQALQAQLQPEIIHRHQLRQRI